MWSPDSSRQTIAVVGAGFSGTALAHRLLQADDWPGRVVLIECSGRFGPGLAYGGLNHKAVLNVPAGNMSLDERRPTDFVDYVRSRDIDAQPQDFLPRRLYGRYLKDRLDGAERTSMANARLVRVSGVATSVTRTCGGDGLIVSIDDGRRIIAGSVVLATGHSTPAALSALSPLEGTSVYVRDPWSTLPSCHPEGRVLIVGTGLSMADVVCDLVDRPGAPTRIVAVSRHGLMPGVRDSSPWDQSHQPFEPKPLAPSTRLSALVAAARRAVREAEARGGSWREVMAALRMNTAQLWAGLPLVERQRFLRHLQPYWEAHRHLLPPQVGRTVQAELRAGRLEIRAARIVSAQPWKQGAQVTLRARGQSQLEAIDVDQVINCTGPLADPGRSRSQLVRGLLEAGWLTPDPTGCGVVVDGQCRLIDRTGAPVPGVYYLGPWLRARDWEATAVGELRRTATSLADLLVRTSTASLLPQRVPNIA